jgi:hypothetical protein
MGVGVERLILGASAGEGEKNKSLCAPSSWLGRHQVLVSTRLGCEKQRAQSKRWQVGQKISTRISSLEGKLGYQKLKSSCCKYMSTSSPATLVDYNSMLCT